MTQAKRLQIEPGFRIGIYIRVSTEEQAQNPEGSIKSQEQRLRSHIEFRNQEKYFGEVSGVFIDRAKSGKDTNRAELRRLLQAVKNREISLVLVTELSRLSRSMKDFCEMRDLMRESGCEFQSLREQFDTTTAAGEMVLYTIANIAQFERKQCSERIRANLLARAQRGLFNGGALPLGFAVDPERRGHLKIVPEEAELVRAVYQACLEEGSLSRAARALNERGLVLPKKRANGSGSKSRTGHFSVENVFDIAKNRMYIAKRGFALPNGKRDEVPAAWEPIVSESLFNRVAETLKENKYRFKKPGLAENRFPYVLSGKVFCAVCGDTLNGKSAHGNGGKIGYYEHGWATRRQSCLNKPVFKCEPHRVLAKRLEEPVWNEIISLLGSDEIAKEILKNAVSTHGSQSHVAESDRLRSKISGTEEQIEALAEHLAKIPKGLSPEPIFKQMRKLTDIAEGLKTELNTLLRQENGVADLPASFRYFAAYREFLKNLLLMDDSLELRRKVIRALVHRIEVQPDTYVIHFYAGKSRVGFATEATKSRKGPGYTPGPALLFEFGSNELTNGWPARD